MYYKPTITVSGEGENLHKNMSVFDILQQCHAKLSINNHDVTPNMGLMKLMSQLNQDKNKQQIREKQQEEANRINRK
ncbi:hypothetical protein PAPYR_9346 [Paratrimastix pyriformis]|uniref:Uncharacterized protein n=1 Tax=Paratrimastix pyriformis TaxID=342808 RepID=A0ABQ8UB67_9EUKA|nr:hypothetical protein PAPYR_9346 [Paratrimastix pyriformis]